MEIFRIDEGHVFDYEDFVFYVKWKVNDLKEQGYSDQNILEFDYCANWDYFAEIFLKQIKSDKT